MSSKKQFTNAQYEKFLMRPYLDDYGINQDEFTSWWWANKPMNTVNHYGLTSSMFAQVVTQLKSKLGAGYLNFLLTVKNENTARYGWIGNRERTGNYLEQLDQDIDLVKDLLTAPPTKYGVADSAPEINGGAKLPFPKEMYNFYNSLNDYSLGKYYMTATLAGNCCVWLTSYADSQYFGNPYDTIINTVQSLGGNPFEVGGNNQPPVDNGGDDKMVDLPENVRQTVTFQRYAKKDTVTGKVTYGQWNATSATIPEYKAPTLTGYYATPSVLPALSVTPDPLTPSIYNNVVYRKSRTPDLNPDTWVNENGETVKINQDYHLGKNQGDAALAENNILICHSTADPNATAKQVANYEKNTVDNNGAYVHFIVDDSTVCQVGDLKYVAWGAGYTANHQSPCQIELCEFPNDINRAMQAYRNYVALIRKFATILNIPITLDDSSSRGIKTHSWTSQRWRETDHTDPYTYFSQIGITKAQFKRDIEQSTGTDVPVNPDWNGAGADPSGIIGNNQYLKTDKNNIPQGFTVHSGTFTNGSVAVNNHEWAPTTANKSTGALPAYASQKYDSYAKIGKYTWIHYAILSKASGIYHQYYMATIEWSADGSHHKYGTGVPLS